ncbi:MAG: class I SAM-dependent methyltransferase [Clostridiales bacterium]|jgi:tRNA (adenine22-N1)-methyltransferase|nr:class I SAM-dependent methyltransferase [Clostridiales bacterium]
MVISRRLQAILNQLHCSSLADIGSDHAYIPISACQRGIIQSAIAVDISRGSLNKAEKNIRSAGLSDRIETRLGYGLDSIAPGEVECLVISGMGGLLIRDILMQGLFVVDASKQLALQPQTDAPALRAALHGMGLAIADEQMVLEDGKFYNIINCAKGPDDDYTPADIAFGRILIKRKDLSLKMHLAALIEEDEKALEAASTPSKTLFNKPRRLSRLNELNKKIAMEREVLRCL